MMIFIVGLLFSTLAYADDLSFHLTCNVCEGLTVIPRLKPERGSIMRQSVTPDNNLAGDCKLSDPTNLKCSISNASGDVDLSFRVNGMEGDCISLIDADDSVWMIIDKKHLTASYALIRNWLNKAGPSATLLKGCHCTIRFKK